MKKVISHLLMTACTLFLLACDKEGTGVEPEVIAPAETGSKHLISTVNWATFGVQATYHYNPDSTMKQVIAGNGHGAINYLYQSKQLAEVNPEVSISKVRFGYNSNGRIITMEKILKIEPDKPIMRFEYTYNANGSVAGLKYFDINEGGSRLTYTSIYSYNAQGLISEISSLGHNGNKVIWSIEDYSDAFDYDSLVFTPTELAPLYELYNLPVLRQLDRLPRKVTRTVQIGAQAPIVDTVYEMAYTITDRKLEKVVTNVSYPQHPGNNSSSEVLYSYY